MKKIFLLSIFSVQMRFVADRMLGKLCTWLRILGYDTVYAGSLCEGCEEDEKNDVEEDNRILSFARKEKRILLTRDKELAFNAERAGVKSILVRSDDLDGQLCELVSSLNLRLEPVAERCSECNAPIRLVKRSEEAKLRSIDYVPKALIGKIDFWICDACGRIYWEGSHWRAIRERLKRIESIRGANLNECHQE